MVFAASQAANSPAPRRDESSEFMVVGNAPGFVAVGQAPEVLAMGFARAYPGLVQVA
jgi:hypothetical protein